jgi:hypothetical protein
MFLWLARGELLDSLLMLDAALPSEGVVVFRINALLEESVEGNELALVSDANPDTPTECDRFPGRTRGLCQPLDAPYNEKGKSYAFSYYDLSADIVLNNKVFWDDSARIAFRVDPTGSDVFKITFGRSKDEVISTSVTTTTTQTTSAQTTETAFTPSDAQPLLLGAVLAAVLLLVIFAALRARTRRAVHPRPPAYPTYPPPTRPVPPPQVKYCINCGAPMPEYANVCPKCGAAKM